MINLKTIKQGDIVYAEDGHQCLRTDQRCVVLWTERAGFHVLCINGIHCLEPEDDSGDVLGFRRMQ